MLHISLPWLAFCMSRDSLPTNGTGDRVEIPVPWLIPRFRPEAFGYSWWIKWLSGGEFIESCDILRDTGLDLDDHEEMLRAQLVYPETRQDLERYQRILLTRKATPDAFIQAQYRCSEHWIVDGIKVPRTASLTYYLPGPIEYPNPWFYGRIDTESVSQLSEPLRFKAGPEIDVEVWDYRYRRFNGRQLYRVARYALSAGQQWKSDADPSLLLEAESYLRHGPRYNAFPMDRKKIVVWLLFTLSLVGLAAVMQRLRTKRVHHE